MKKGLLLGVLALSVIAVGADTTTVSIETRLNLTNNGIIITPDEGGVETNTVSLDHGDQDGSIDSEVSGVKAYIKTPTGQIPAGRNLKVALISDAANVNNLKTGTGSAAELIAHTLTGVVEGGTAVNSTLQLAESTTTSETNVTTTGDALAIAFSSKVLKEDLQAKLSGSYLNTSTLSVTVLAN